MSTLEEHKLDKEQNKARRYNSNKRRWSLLNYKSLEPIIEVLEYGAHKYTIYEHPENIGEEIKGSDIPIRDKHKYKVKISGENNWKNGLNNTEILESMQRHLAALLDGETHDPESGLSHIGHIGCNYMFYAYNTIVNRPSQPLEPSISFSDSITKMLKEKSLTGLE